jgi:very-short-patch-repair endonuclease
MVEKQSSADSRVWARRDRSMKSRNETRARAMRIEPTEAERKLWWNLRHRMTLPVSHCRRQVRLGRYIVDFASHGLKVVSSTAVRTRNEVSSTQIERDSSKEKAIAYCVSGITT